MHRRDARAATDQVEGGMSLMGEALSGLVLGTDGAWPCQAIRELLEHENDPLLESGLLNGRGATTRTACSGGQQECDLEARYKKWADQVRGAWPRGGALLDSCLLYTSDAADE